MATIKRKHLSLDCKVAVIKAFDSAKKKADVGREFNLPISTVCTIIKNRDTIVKNVDDGKGQFKKLRLCGKTDIDGALIKWFNQCRSAF